MDRYPQTRRGDQTRRSGEGSSDDLIIDVSFQGDNLPVSRAFIGIKIFMINSLYAIKKATPRGGWMVLNRLVFR